VNANLQSIEHCEFVKLSDIIGNYRFIQFFKNGKQVKNYRRKGEIFFSVQRSPHQGYTRLSPLSEEIFKGLIQDQRENNYIEFIRHLTHYLVIFRDGTYISSNFRKVTIEEMDEWLAQNEGVNK